MAVFRVEKTKDFTIMCNHHLRNRKLSLKAKGLLSLMLSLPEDWDYTTKGLAHICKDGIDAISTALKELEQQGYLTRERVRLPNGRLGDIEYTIHEQPATLDIPPNSPKRENPRQVNPGQAFPEQVKPEQENHAQLNTNRPKTEKENTDISSTHQSIYPKAGERKYNSETQDRMDWMDEANAYRDLIMTNIEYDILCERHGEERMDEVVELMLEAVISKRPYIRIAGDEFDQAILTHVRDAYNLAIGERTAEDIKIKVGSAVPLKDELDVEVNGRDVITGLPKTVRIESEEIRRALNKPLDEMAKAVKDALDATPPDLASDLMYYGILLTGGGALLRGLDVRLRDETGVSVNVSPTALDNVVNGCARVLEANAFDGGFVQTNA